MNGNELLMRNPGILAIHAVTSANSLHFIYGASGDTTTRRLALLQAVGWQPLFRDRIKPKDAPAIDALEAVAPESSGDDAVGEIFAEVNQSRARAAAKALGYLERGGSADLVFDAARRMIFHKGRDSHDYKYAAAAWEECQLAADPKWCSPARRRHDVQPPGRQDRRQPADATRPRGRVDRLRYAGLIGSRFGAHATDRVSGLDRSSSSPHPPSGGATDARELRCGHGRRHLSRASPDPRRPRVRPATERGGAQVPLPDEQQPVDPAHLRHRLDQMGIQVEESAFHTSALATADFLRLQKPGGTAYVIGGAGLTDALYGVGYTLTEHNPDYVVVGDTRSYDFEKIKRAIRLILAGPASSPPTST